MDINCSFTNACKVKRNFKARSVGRQKILYTGKYSSPFYVCPFRPRYQGTNLKQDEFQCFKLSFFKQNCVGANLRRGEAACNYSRAKFSRGENNPEYSTYFFYF